MLITSSIVSSLVLSRDALADVEQVSESDANAQALGYKTDATTVDKTKYPKYQISQTCSNCQFFQGKAGDTAGPCQIFGGKQVSAKAWCSAYLKKA